MGRLRDPEKWTNEETQKLIDLAKAGHTSAEICRITGRTYGAISTKATRINLQFRGARSAADFDPSKQRDRPCLKCEGPFISPWIGIRVCDECKDSDEWQYA